MFRAIAATARQLASTHTARALAGAAALVVGHKLVGGIVKECLTELAQVELQLGNAYGELGVLNSAVETASEQVKRFRDAVDPCSCGGEDGCLDGCMNDAPHPFNLVESFTLVVPTPNATPVDQVDEDQGDGHPAVTGLALRDY